MLPRTPIGYWEGLHVGRQSGGARPVGLLGFSTVQLPVTIHFSPIQLLCLHRFGVWLVSSLNFLRYRYWDDVPLWLPYVDEVRHKTRHVWRAEHMAVTTDELCDGRQIDTLGLWVHVTLPRMEHSVDYTCQRIRTRSLVDKRITPEQLAKRVYRRISYVVDRIVGRFSGASERTWPLVPVYR